jgi:hypothetical protein
VSATNSTGAPAFPEKAPSMNTFGPAHSLRGPHAANELIDLIIACRNHRREAIAVAAMPVVALAERFTVARPRRSARSWCTNIQPAAIFPVVNRRDDNPRYTRDTTLSIREFVRPLSRFECNLGEFYDRRCVRERGSAGWGSGG